MKLNSKPLFSIVTVGRNESKTLPRLLDSLKEFFARGGEMIFVDTGSADGTVDVARKGGATVFEVGDRFTTIIDQETADAINEKFVVAPDPAIVKAGDRFFSFADSRNYAKGLAKNDFLCTPDCDEAWTTLNIDAINELITLGYEKLMVPFVFSHFPDGSPAVKFSADTRFYDRRKIYWKGIIHETQQHDGEVKTASVGEDVAYLEHYQNTETDRSKYLSGLGWACYQEPDNDRNSHYFGRELMYRGHYHSAIKELRRHIAMGKWPTERGQSMIFLGSCLTGLGPDHYDEALEWWNKAIGIGDPRREPWLTTALFWMKQDNKVLASAYATAALEISNCGFYANDVANYTTFPHEVLYWAKGWLGDIPAAREHILKCLEYQPYNPKYLEDTKYYFSKEEQGEIRKKSVASASKFVRGRVINRIALPITRECNRNCPECSARMADPNWKRGNSHVPVDELKWVGKTLGPIRTIEMTGGEPSIHPDFEEISKNIHDWFQCDDIMVLTNAVEFLKHPDKLPLLLNYDRVYISWYTNDFAVKYGVGANTEAVNFVEDYLKMNGKKAWVQRMDEHTPIGKPPYKGIPTCGYNVGDSVGYGDKRIYGCCSAYWLPDRGTSIPLTEDWRSHLSELVTPCASCFLTGGTQ